MILTHHGMNGLSRGGSPSLDGFIYLTYFNQFPPSTVQYNEAYDIPVVGPTTLWQPTTNPFNRVLLDEWRRSDWKGPDYEGIPGFLARYGGNLTDDSNLMSFINGNDTVSIEGIFNLSSSFDERGEPWGSFNSINDGFYYYAGYNYYNGSRGCCVGIPGSVNLDYLSPEFVEIAVDVNKVHCLFPESSSWRQSSGTHHFAFVLDKTNNKIKAYLDGVLAGIGDSIISMLHLIISNSSYWVGMQFTQFAIRQGDCSINGGAEYPVPLTPYVTDFR